MQNLLEIAKWLLMRMAFGMGEDDNNNNEEEEDNDNDKEEKKEDNNKEEDKDNKEDYRRTTRRRSDIRSILVLCSLYGWSALSAHTQWPPAG